MEENKNMNRSYVFVKNISGSLNIALDSYNMALPRREFIIPFNVDTIMIPHTYALGLFITQDALNAFNQGLFSIQQYEELQQEGIDLGLAIGIDVPNIKSVSQLKELLINDDMNAICKVITDKKPTEICNLISAAVDCYDDLKSAMITKIETACGVELSVA